MTELNPEDRRILEAIKQNKSDAWEQLISLYQGRLLKYAFIHLPQQADAEDVVQSTFTALLKAIQRIEIQLSLETYLFSILRNEIANHYRSYWARSICLVQDVFSSRSMERSANLTNRIPTNDPSLSWCIEQNEQKTNHLQALSVAIRSLIEEFKKKKNFDYLKIVEAFFFSGLNNREVSLLLDIDIRIVRVAKHRSIKRIRQLLRRQDTTEKEISYSEDVIRIAWESQRLSCPKRSTLGAFMLEELEPQWYHYVDYHLTTLGCHFCRASYKDLAEEQNAEENTLFQQRILASTIGFLTK